MPNGPKIATCCYCSTRTVLRLTAREGHELACGSCGAPLHKMKALKQSEARQGKRGRPAPASFGAQNRKPPRHHAKRKRRKPMWKKAFEEAFDLVEDIFD
ncbi:hypothetical protein E2K80_11320 [Rhodophyticola sp. CCM32]|uniref:hypothetical protein n=1 Tax=Rhodophyticola sp. CCM32 TaxID=2916397 RepID=UPI00107F1271|nr:hypothetical protein [Rhodophyticola sp. CCM32]QBY01242.1 hypothetical protein E2K80_11320 [Rhodophyticola sp. CCM32]